MTFTKTLSTVALVTIQEFNKFSFGAKALVVTVVAIPLVGAIATSGITIEAPAKSAPEPTKCEAIFKQIQEKRRDLQAARNWGTSNESPIVKRLIAEVFSLANEHNRNDCF